MQLSNKNRRKPSVRNGYTLVELLVGLVLSLFIGGMALTYFVTSSRSFANNASGAFIQENSRFALYLLTRGFRRAGLDTEANLDSSDLTMVFSEPVCGDDGDESCSTTGSGLNGSDQIALNYIHEEAQTCNGTTVSDFFTSGNGERVVDVYSVENSNGINSLICTTYLFNTDTNALTPQPNAASASVALVGGIDAINYQFGVDTNNDWIVDSYTGLAGIDAGDFWNNVRTVKIGVLVSTGQDVANINNVEQQNPDRTYSIFGNEIAVNDRLARKLFFTTVHLPNSPDA